MSRKVKFQIGYSEYVLLTMDEAAKLAALLDGKSVVCETWIEDGRYTYIQDEGYVTDLSFTDGKTVYHTQEDYETAKQAEQERKDAA